MRFLTFLACLVVLSLALVACSPPDKKKIAETQTGITDILPPAPEKPLEKAPDRPGPEIVWTELAKLSSTDFAGFAGKASERQMQQTVEGASAMAGLVADEAAQANLAAQLAEAEDDPVAQLRLAAAAIAASGKGAYELQKPEGRLTDLRIDGDRATAQGSVVSGEGSARMSVGFIREGGEWRLDSLKPYEEPPAAPVPEFAKTLQDATELTRKGKYKEAEALWSAFITAAPSHPQANFELGRVLYLKGDLKGAEKQCKMACMLGEDDGCVQAKLIGDQLSQKPE